jgi:hypothetical protein
MRLPNSCSSCRPICICCKIVHYGKTWTCLDYNYRYHRKCVVDDVCPLCAGKCNLVWMVSLNEIKDTTFRQLQCTIDREEEKHCVLSVDSNGSLIQFLLTAINNSWQLPLLVSVKKEIQCFNQYK